jgi:gamma-polyglutamate biosynthesis protein CapC
MDAKVVFVGLVSALLFTAISGYYPGGMVVPGYLALFVHEPLRLAATWLIALFTCLSFRLAAQGLILFGRRRFVFMILAGGMWTFVWLALFPRLFPLTLEMKVVGWVIPGLLANYFERQGVLVTTAAVIVVTVFVYFVGQALNLLF